MLTHNVYQCMKPLSIAIALVVIIGIGAAVIAVTTVMRQSETGESMMESKSPEVMMEKDSTTDGDAMMPENDAMMASGTNTAMTGDAMMKDDQNMTAKGQYVEYSAAAVEAQQRAGNKVVLFFHAPWCPFCRSADAAFQSRTGDIPAGVAVFKADYDTNTELKRQYGVTYQHTFVQIDADERLVTKWNGGDIDMLKQQVK